jgi:hypothetical protein
VRTSEIATKLAGFEQRGAGRDGERRAAHWLAQEIEAAGQISRIEPFWCRPNWAMAHAWHVALGLAGTLTSVSSPRVGGALLVAALASIVADELTGISPGRRLTPERASQNVVGASDKNEQHRIRLIVTANYDVGRVGLIYRPRVRRSMAKVRAAARNLPPGWLGWLTIALNWLLVIAILRLAHHKGALIGALQLIPTVGLVLALALLVDVASAGFGASGDDNASGTAVAMAVGAALNAAPPAHVSVELVLQGASAQSTTGLRRYLRARRRERKARNTVVLGIGPCAAGELTYLTADGPLVPLRYFRRLVELCAKIASEQPNLNVRPRRGRATDPALAARMSRLPAVAISREGSTGEAGMDAALQFALMLVDEIDAFVARTQRADQQSLVTQA